MSQQVVVDFEGVSTKIHVQCDMAAHSLCKIDKTIEYIKNNASKVENHKMIEYEEYLLKSKNKLQKQIYFLVEKISEYKYLKKQRIDSDIRYANSESNTELVKKWDELNSVLAIEGNKLEQLVAELTGAKLAVIEQMISENLLEKIDEHSKKTQDKINGVVHFDKRLVEQINNIKDISLRELAYQQMVNGEYNFNVIMQKAKKEYDILLSKSTFVQNVKEEMKAAGISNEEIEEIVTKPITCDTANQISEYANTAISDEKIRKETLKVIINAIRDRGFIVDTKNSLKIDKKTNIVKLVAKKADGKTAEFEIQLNGKFMYHFDGYIGQACQKDITPFMDDLKNIYDINILREEYIWSNPDKVQKKQYQYQNTNKNKK